MAEGPELSVAPGLDGKWKQDTDFPLILPHSTFSFCAKLICRCLLKLNIRRLKLGVRPDQTLIGPGGQWCLGPSSSGYTIPLVFTCMGSKESGVLTHLSADPSWVTVRVKGP